MINVLIVDDEMQIRQGLEKHVQWAAIGAQVVGVAETGRIALKMCAELHPDLVITDIRMPDLTGLELIKLLREQNNDVKVIIISGYSDFSYAQQSLRYQVVDYLLKPVDEQALCTCILRAFSQTGRIPKTAQQTANSLSSNTVIQQAESYLKTNYFKNLTLQVVADEIHIHPNYLSGLFTKILGKSFSTYLMDLRIEKAKLLLQNTPLKIYEISDMVGYNDYHWFSKVFKQKEGKTPQQYRASFGSDASDC